MYRFKITNFEQLETIEERFFSEIKVQYAEDIMARLLNLFYYIDIQVLGVRLKVSRMPEVLEFQNRQSF